MNPDEQRSRIAVLLFTDMVDSVALERRLGTQAYSRLLQLHHQLFHDALKQISNGKVHFDTGDGFLAEFSTAANAVNVALLFQLALRETKWDAEAPKVRIGLHQGQLAEIRVAPESPGKIVGIPVSIAHRVMSVAQPGQILMTRAVYDDARQFVREHPLPDTSSKSRPALRWKGHGTYLFKGNEEPIEVFEVGASGVAPLTPPPNTEKARRADSVAAPLPRLRRAPPRPVLLSILTALCGLALWALPLGDPWINASYDALFRFGNRMPTNHIVLILMDDYTCTVLGQSRSNWDRGLHAALLNKLADAGCPLVAFDIHFKDARNADSDAALAAAIKRHGHVALMSKATEPYFRQVKMIGIIPPNTNFLEAAAAIGVGAVNVTKPEEVARRHWPFAAPVEEGYESLPWAAAKLAGAQLGDKPEERWLRYYGANGPWETFTYHFALSNAPAYFRDKIVFVGNEPRSSNPMPVEEDKFVTPYTARNGEAVGGVKILATTFLNLVNGDWLRRPAWPIEMLVLIMIGAGAGLGFVRLKPIPVLWVSAAAAIVVTLLGVSLSYFTNYWFPWLIVVAAQIPCALVCAFVPGRVLSRATQPAPAAAATRPPAPAEPQPTHPAIPEYELLDPAIGEGAFGKVWLGRSAIGQWQAIKVVRRSSFHNDFQYNTEFEGIKKYKPVSERHSGLLRIELVSAKKAEGYFYYVMELGDAQKPGWQDDPALYKPRTLASVRSQAPLGRLPIEYCIEIGLTLAEALDFLHTHNLTHRDIKPSNVVFVQDRAKLADVGLVTDARLLDSKATRVGTPGYMPPPPEAPGTRQADIYALGMVLYVISTGREPEAFPELSTTLVDHTGNNAFMSLDAVILKACQLKPEERYASVADLRTALQNAKDELTQPRPSASI